MKLNLTECFQEGGPKCPKALGNLGLLCLQTQTWSLRVSYMDTPLVRLAAVAQLSGGSRVTSPLEPVRFCKAAGNSEESTGNLVFLDTQC